MDNVYNTPVEYTYKLFIDEYKQDLINIHKRNIAQNAKYGCLLGKHMMSACVEMILCLLFPITVTVVRISMNHKEEKRATGNKIQQDNVQKYFTYHVKYGWLFEKRTMCFKMICTRKFEIFGQGLCVKRPTFSHRTFV